MGQKVNPIGLRVGINRTWDSRWFAGRGQYAQLLHEDIEIVGGDVHKYFPFCIGWPGNHWNDNIQC